MLDEFVNILACPQTQQPLIFDGVRLVSEDKHYPIINGIPWLFSHPENTLLDWGVKLGHFHQVLVDEIHTLEKEMAQAHGITLQRLTALVTGKREFHKRVSELLHPIINTPIAPKRIYQSLQGRAPTTQNLLSYESNIYRDWCWGEEENALTLDYIKRYLPKHAVNKVLIPGAGACRLAVDLHNVIQPEMTIATDINPLMFLLVKQLIAGNRFSFYEFPLHPKTLKDIAVEHTLAPPSLAKGFYQVFSDVNQPAFIKHGFDLVVTPWLIDIQPLAFEKFMRQLNQYLPCGATWINFGSLVFNQKRDSLCYSIEEVKNLAESQGFILHDIEQYTIPYLKSPHSAGYRMENIWVWRAEKVEDKSPLKTVEQLPDWFNDIKKPIKQEAYLRQFSFTHKLYANLVDEVDGKKSIEQIGKKLAKQNKMHPDEGVDLVTKFLLDVYTRSI